MNPYPPPPVGEDEGKDDGCVFDANPVQNRDDDLRIRLGEFADPAQRIAEEAAWMLRKDGTTESFSEMLPDPMASLVVGVNAHFACALTARDTGTLEGAALKDGLKSHQQMKAYLDARGSVNAAILHKTILWEAEGKAFLQYGRGLVHKCAGMADRIALGLEEMEVIRAGDVLLSPHASAIDALLKRHQSAAATEETSQPHHSYTYARLPGGVHAECVEMEVPTPPAPPAEMIPTRPHTIYEVMLCRVPLLDPEKAKKRMKKWRNTNIRLRVREGTTPTAAMNDELVVLIYCDAEKSSNPLEIRLAAYSLEYLGTSNQKNPPPLWTAALQLPYEEFQGSGSDEILLLHAYAAERHLVLGFGSKVLYYEWATTELRIFSLVPHKKKYRRTITCVSLTRDQQLLFGTHYGEAYRVDLSSGNYTVARVPAVEPVFAIHWMPSSRGILIQTIMNLFVEIPEMARYELQSQRVMATDRCGQLVFFVSKYGHVQAYNLFVSGMWRRWDPPSAGASTLYLQHAYRGICALPTHVVILYLSGMIRVITLVQKSV